jgi:hypothetical protein
MKRTSSDVLPTRPAISNIDSPFPKVEALMLFYTMNCLFKGAFHSTLATSQAKIKNIKSSIPCQDSHENAKATTVVIHHALQSEKSLVDRYCTTAWLPPSELQMDSYHNLNKINFTLRYAAIKKRIKGNKLK